MKRLRKKHYALLGAAAVAVAAAVILVCLWAPMRIPGCWLPAQAKSFIATHFPSASCVYAERDWDDGRKEYGTKLSDGTDIDFYASGEWKKVYCAYTLLPAGIVPQAIVEDAAARYPGARIYQAARERGGYEIFIGGGPELIYSADGTLVRVDRD